MRVVLIGSGNTATVLGKLIVRADHEMLQVFSRQTNHARELAAKLDCDFTTDLEMLRKDADLYLVAIADNALLNIESWLNTGRKLVMHTAGSVSMQVLEKVSMNFGILYPLQSLRKDLDEIPEVPLLIDANTPENLALIEDFARSLSQQVYHANDHQRESTHLAAVIVSNFSNHLYTLAADFCSKENLDFKMLQPLIEEVATRLRSTSPNQVQTGPAIRNDLVTIEKHLNKLSAFPELQRFYQLFSEEIIHYYKK